VATPYTFELVGRQKASLFHIVKPSKYTQDMNNLEPSHLRGKPIDLARAMRTLAEMGYTRVDHMAYMTNHHQRAYTWREELAAGEIACPRPKASSRRRRATRCSTPACAISFSTPTSG
jgi:hypothetical protein